MTTDWTFKAPEAPVHPEPAPAPEEPGGGEAPWGGAEAATSPEGDIGGKGTVPRMGAGAVGEVLVVVLVALLGGGMLLHLRRTRG